MTGQDTTGWVAWRVTQPEPAAPSWSELNAAERMLWTRDAQGMHIMAEIWPELDAWIAREFPGCHSRRSPGATGISLIEHTLPWDKQTGKAYRYPKLPDALARLFAATAPQHRVERFTPEPERGPVYSYDARLAYVRHYRHLPVILGDLVHDELDVYVPFRNGRYRVLVTVPSWWHRVGLVHRAAPGGTWEWPSKPGTEWECWVDECELRLLEHHNWSYKVLERILFADYDQAGADPVRAFQERMSRALEQFDAAKKQTPITRAKRYALRAIALYPVGWWHRSGNKQDSPAMIFSTPADAEAWLADHPADHTLSAFQQRWRRPEWSTAVYARTRVEATHKLLGAEGTVYAIVGDEVRTAQPQLWVDTGRVGAYRLKGAQHG